jgi:hypothetical protein
MKPKRHDMKVGGSAQLIYMALYFIEIKILLFLK